MASESQVLDFRSFPNPRYKNLSLESGLGGKNEFFLNSLLENISDRSCSLRGLYNSRSVSTEQIAVSDTAMS